MLDKEFHIRFTLADVGKLLCFSPVVVVLAYVVICLPWNSVNAPAWVQAIGSIAAIVVAVMIANHQQVVAMRRSKAEERQRAAGHAGRLAFLVLEIERVMSDVVLSTHQPGVAQVDARTADVLDVMLSRLNRNFDDDLDLDRVGFCYEIRMLLSASIFTLRASAGLESRQRDDEIARFKVIAKDILNKCADHAREVRRKV